MTRQARREKTKAIKSAKRREREFWDDQYCQQCGCMLYVWPGCGDDTMRPAHVTGSSRLRITENHPIIQS
jgi:hypothetical protein